MTETITQLLADWADTKAEYATPYSIGADIGEIYSYACRFEEIIRQQQAMLERAETALNDAKAALERTVVHAHKDNVWINSRVKGSAMWHLQDPNPDFVESFRGSARLNDIATRSVNDALAALSPDQKVRG